MANDKQFQMRVDDSFFEKLDAWREAQPDKPSRSEAVRALVEKGIEHSPAAEPSCDVDTWPVFKRQLRDSCLNRALDSDDPSFVVQRATECAMADFVDLKNLIAYQCKAFEAPRNLWVLTGREQEVVAYVAAGLSNKAIAETLHISEQTVKVHLHSLLSKMRAKNRTQASEMYRQVIEASTEAAGFTNPLDS